MEELKVGNIVISKQGTFSENYNKFKNIVNNKKINVIVVGQGDRVRIENILNNNSMVCKLYYKNFSILYTGDIEKIAEEQILEEYVNDLNVLKSTVLKVGHHGSKTSSYQDFLNVVRPKIALIGVGKDNKFGHPNVDVIKRIENLRCKNLQNR